MHSCKIIAVVILVLSLSCVFAARFREYKDPRDHEHKFSHKHFSRFVDPKSRKDASRCDSDPITVNLIPHSHDDVGWLKTLDQYFWGDQDQIQRAGVQYIIDSVVDELVKDPTRKFIYVEIGFFQRWWRQQTNAMKDVVRGLVKSGQLEFINGGYCMNDEAGPYYEDVIDQMTVGHQFLLQEFGVIPTIGWQIDPFGHANAQGALFAQMGFNAVFLGRIDYQEKTQRMRDQSLEMLWVPRTTQGAENQILAHVLFRHYSAPPKFCFDIACRDEPIKDDIEAEDYNLVRRSTEFVDYFKDQCLHFLSNDIMHTMGDDFTYRDAQQNYKNMDKLVNYINANPDKFGKIKMIYSTPSQYIKTISGQNITFTKKVDDFFPYADVPSGFWTGYFTSRVALKGYIREIGRWSQQFKKLVGLLLIDNKSKWIKEHVTEVLDAVQVIDEAMGINQHHDAVAGTAKQKVTDDYAFILSNAQKKTIDVLNGVFTEVYGAKVNFTTCVTNVTAAHCNITWDNLKNNKTVQLTLFHGSADRNVAIRTKVPHGKVKVMNGKSEIPADVICANSTDNTDCDLFFTAFLQSDSFNSFDIVPTDKSISVPGERTIPWFNTSRTIEFNENVTFKVKFSNRDFVYTQCEKKIRCKDFPFTLDYRYYISYVRPKNSSEQNSGAYIFRPDESTMNRSLPYDKIKNSVLYLGKTIVQIRIEWENLVTDLRFYRNDLTSIEFETFVGPINVEDGKGKEITINFQTDLNNNKVFWTDSYGMEMQNRTLNYRETWELNQTQPVAGNYYPINSAIYLEDPIQNSRMTVLTDRTQGGAATQKGEIEIMIHRRLLYDDSRGVDEPLNETDWDGQGFRQRVKHYLILSNISDSSFKQRNLQVELDQTPLTLLSNVPKASSYNKLNKLLPSKSNALLTIPPQVKAFIRPYENDTYVVRFHYVNETNTITFDAPDAFAKFKNVTEVSLTANQNKKKMLVNKVMWNGQKLDLSKIPIYDHTNGQITLRGQEIKTFLLQGRATTNDKKNDRGIWNKLRRPSKTHKRLAIPRKGQN